MSRRVRTTRWWPMWLGIAAMLVYLMTAQRQLYNDGIFFEHKLRLGGEHLIYNHMLYLPLVKLLQLTVSLVHPIDGEDAMRLLGAIVGGVGVGLCHVVARECLGSANRAAACAFLMASFVGYWFHATATELHGLHAVSSMVLLLGLFRTLDRRHPGSIGNCVILAVGAFAAPASHVTGICIAVPLFCVWVCVPGARLRYSISVGSGLLLFGVAYFAIIVRDDGFAGYTAGHSAKYAVLWQNPGHLLALIKASVAEATLYALPAATLVPAGLRVLFRTAPGHAWFCICWLLAWPMVAWSVGDRMFGAYYVPTFPVQALLAIIAMQAAGRGWARALLVAVLGFLPMPVFLFSGGFDPELLGLGAMVLAGTAVFAMVRGTAERGARRLWLLPVASTLVAGPLILKTSNQDVIRDRISIVTQIVERVEHTVGKPALLVFLATNGGMNAHWKHFFPGAYGHEDRAFNPLELAYAAKPEDARQKLAKYQSILRGALAADRPILLEGAVDTALRTASRCPDLRRFFDELYRSTRSVPTHAPNLIRLMPRE